MECLRSSASHHAMLFAFMAKETIDTFGEKGKETLTKGVIRYGNQRGHRMALRTLADGNALNVMDYLVYGEWEAAPGQMDLRFPSYNPEVCMQNYKCPWYSEWEKRGLLEYGIFYCQDVDSALVKGYNPDMELQMLKNRVMGDECCDFFFTAQCIADKDFSTFQDRRTRIGKKAKMPWEYHTSHLYKTIKETIVEVFGKNGEDTVKRALDAYEHEYGIEAKDLVLKYADLDFVVMPDYPGIDG